jgi:NADH-quinone oxidoreductase subunit F
MIEDMGAKLECGKALGRDFTLSGLKEDGYEAVFVGVGAPQGSTIGIPGEDGPGVYDGLSFLKEYNLTGSAPVGKKVAVIGGGNAAIDAARTALRLGAEEVRILYRRTRAQMPAWAEEVDAADLEGIQVLTLIAPQEIVRDASGNVTGVACKEMALGDYDKSGRRRPVAGHNPDFVVEADTVIAAIGQWLDAEPLMNGTRIDTDRKGYFATDRQSGRTSEEWVFAGGDAVTGPASVVAAIGAGEKAAVAIDEFLTGANHAFWRREFEVPTAYDPDADPVEYDRAAVEELPLEQRVAGFDEVELGWAAPVAVAEARRCLRCDYGKYCS